MLYCPHCGRTYSLHDYLTILRPLNCFHCGNKRLVRWDKTTRARRRTFGPLETIFVPGERP